MKYAKLGAPAVVLAALLWSVDGLLRRHLYVLPSTVIVLWEHILGFVVLVPFVLTSLNYFKQLSRRQWLAITVVAFLSGAVGTILYTAALGRIHYIPFSIVILLQQLNPVFAIAASAVLLGERLSRRFLVLAVIALFGAYLTAFPHLAINLATGRGTAEAALMAVGAAAAWGTSTAFSKYALKGTSTLHISSLRYSITAVFALLLSWLSGSAKQIGSITGSEFGYLLAITFSTGLIALLIYYYGLKRVAATRSAILELAWPASSVVIGYIWLHQGLTAVQIIGATLLVATIYFISRESQSASDVA